MVFNAVFNSISVISRRPLHVPMLSLSSFKQYYILSKPLAAFQHNETMDSGERGINPVAMTIIDPLKEYWPSRGSNNQITLIVPDRVILFYLRVKCNLHDICRMEGGMRWKYKGKNVLFL